ncbi:hypothetical protein [Lacticaseibacillus nasuensis]|uniref:hypothetical protein n=1 Tax=Lacticaseibacillus nasuensis TaxID=944671 RepID=UPI002246E025|nr:hypothetical protein [Lacticaseibacillus nasuensis]MCX2456336.1 hypothetical protein [Lacticaseibacillus nasuensis]
MRKELLIGGLLVGLAGCATAKPKPATIPSYNSTKAKVLLSNKADHLTDQQEARFWRIARQAAKRGTKGDGDAASWANLKDDALYVAKTAKPHQYQLVYQVKATKPLPVTVSYGMLLRFTKNSLAHPAYKLDGIDTELVK